MKKKILSALLAAAMVLSLGACGSSSSSASAAGSAKEASSGAASSSDLSGNVTVWYHDYSMEKSLQKVIKDFNKKYPDVDVEYEIKGDGDYDSLLKNAIQSGSGPDAFYTQGTATSTMQDLVDNNVLEDLTNVVDYSFISDDAKARGTIDGKIYSVPWMTLDTRTVFYNKDMFKENGWKVPKTFSEFESLLKKIKAKKIVPISVAYEPWSLLFLYEPVLAAYDPSYTAGLKNVTSDPVGKPAKEAMQKLVDWAKAGYFGDNWTGVIDNSAQILAFTSGAAAMDVAGSWDASTIKDNNPDLNLGAFTIPAEDGTTGLVGTAANGFSVNKDSKNLDATNAFVKFCATKQAQTDWVVTSGSVSATDEIVPKDEVAKEISAGAADGNVYRSWQNVLSTCSKDGEAATVMTNDITKTFTNDISVDDFFKEIGDKLDKTSIAEASASDASSTAQ